MKNPLLYPCRFFRLFHCMNAEAPAKSRQQSLEFCMRIESFVCTIIEAVADLVIDHVLQNIMDGKLPHNNVQTM